MIPDRWFRTVPDSSRLPSSRILSRVLVPLARLERQIADYEALQGCRADLRMPIPDFGGLELAAVGGILLIASERPFTPMQRATRFSLIVPDLDRQIAIADGIGAEVLEPVEAILPGRRARLRYCGDVIAELVEHRPLPGELPHPVQAAARRPIGPRLEVPLAELPGIARVFAAVLGRSVDLPDTQHVRVGELVIAARHPVAASDSTTRAGVS
ncbi:hypothetical protein K7711_44110 [Nocardia sp. CA2R105]|uniref:VOC family protein n=1 Tax=Nocardia coffeae TaxID=2873381 RepID=UPI001CA61C13|nr:hypothetical protein [Nocardia coffeae]MBY8863518.1 hypothetical protein [Nocardia coffeae]